MRQGHHICVCICTYKRPEQLVRLLSGLEGQETEGLFDYSIVVADNDRSESARQAVRLFAGKSRIPVRYYVEPIQNIALARNKAIEHARGDFIALIDDDEVPGEQWLLNLYQAVNHFGSDGVLGPVVPCYEKEPPKWVKKGSFFDRPTHPTGHVLDWENTRTGNALLRRGLFTEDRKWFDAAFCSGGEDRDFFRRKIEAGHIFVWCNEAAVHETISTNRWKRTVLVKRALLRGKMAINGSGSKSASILKSAAAIFIYAVSLPLLIVMGHHVFMRYLIKCCDHVGKLLAYMGIDVIKENYVSS